jgi:predicted TIM-barrel fold metal-dependent hydrolase
MSDASTASRPLLVDCDLHNVIPSIEALIPYMEENWAEYCRQSAFRGAADTAYPKQVPIKALPDTAPPEGPPGSHLRLLREQALDAPGVQYGILNCDYAVESIHNPDLAAAMASAINDWQISEWLDKEPRLRASLVMPSQRPEMAAREIERVGGHPGFVQVFLPVRSQALYGERRYHPIYEAATRHDLVIGIEFGGAPGNPPTSSGWPSYYLEEYVDMASTLQSQVLSIIVEGVFDRFPTLRMTLVECGFTWMPSLMWRIDKEWKGLRREVPWSRQLPSSYIREHMRLTTQPVDAPPDPQHLLHIIDQLGSDDLLLYASDYPHATGTNHGQGSNVVERAFGVALPDALSRKIMAENARAWYKLDGGNRDATIPPAVD